MKMAWLSMEELTASQAVCECQGMHLECTPWYALSRRPSTSAQCIPETCPRPHPSAFMVSCVSAALAGSPMGSRPHGARTFWARGRPACAQACATTTSGPASATAPMPTLNVPGQGSLPGEQRLCPQVQHNPKKRSDSPAPGLVKKGSCLKQTTFHIRMYTQIARQLVEPQKRLSNASCLSTLDGAKRRLMHDAQCRYPPALSGRYMGIQCQPSRVQRLISPSRALRTSPALDVRSTVRSHGHCFQMV